MERLAAARNNLPRPPPSTTTPPPSPYRSSEETCNHAPVEITIRIDTSINVIGHGNTIVMSSPSAASRSGSSSNSTVSQDDASSGTTSRNASQRSQSKVTELATGIISALHLSGVFETKDDGSRYSVDFGISAEVCIQGNRNVICGGVRGKNGNRNAAQEQREEHEDKSVIGRKRRAASEPIEILKAKRHSPE